MKVIKEKILVEELQGLILGKTIDFLELDSHKLKIQISGEDVNGFFQKDVEDMDTEYLKNQKEIITRELDKRNKYNLPNKATITKGDIK